MISNARQTLGTGLVALLGLAGAVIVAISGAEPEFLTGWLWTEGVEGAVATGGLLAAIGTVYVPVSLIWRSFSTERDSATALKSTLTPTASKLIDCTHARQMSHEDVRTIVKDLRAFVTTDGTNADANVYVLTGNGRQGRKLERCHQTDTGARPVFEYSKRRDAKSVEETEVVSRILNGDSIICTNVVRRRAQKAFKLSPDSKRNYKAFASVPILDVRDQTPIGMISVNCRETGVLQKYHLDYLEAIATLLAKVHDVAALSSFVGENRSEGRKE